MRRTNEASFPPQSSSWSKALQHTQSSHWPLLTWGIQTCLAHVNAQRSNKTWACTEPFPDISSYCFIPLFSWNLYKLSILEQFSASARISRSLHFLFFLFFEVGILIPWKDPYLWHGILTSLQKSPWIISLSL